MKAFSVVCFVSTKDTGKVFFTIKWNPCKLITVIIQKTRDKTHATPRRYICQRRIMIRTVKVPSVFVFIIFSIIIFPFFWSPSRESFHWSLSEHYSLNQAPNGHFQFRRLPIYSLFIFACKKPCDHSTFLT